MRTPSSWIFHCPFILPLAGAAELRRAQPVAAQLDRPLAYHNVEDKRSRPIVCRRHHGQAGGSTSVGFSATAIGRFSVDDLLAARDGRKALPEKAVLLTFDDGYESFYTRVFPILKAFRFPAVLALVGICL